MVLASYFNPYMANYLVLTCPIVFIKKATTWTFFERAKTIIYAGMTTLQDSSYFLQNASENDLL